MSISQFKTDSGIIAPAITTEQMREVDRIAMEETGPNLFQMMENAGRNLALMAVEILGEKRKAARVVVLSGTGGNGGGGICAARHLANHGIDVTLCITNIDKLGEVPAYQRHIFQSTSGVEVPFEALNDQSFDLIIDAIIGYSLQAAPRGDALEFIQWANSIDAPILSLDVPSGVDSTTGETSGECIHAHTTMTLALPKTGLTSEKTGRLYLADIGIPESVYNGMELDYTIPFKEQYRVLLREV